MTKVQAPRTAETILQRQHRRARIAGLTKKLSCIALVLITLIPFYISVIYSIKYKNEITISHLAWPKNPTLDNYIRVVTENEQFLVGLKNSILTTIPTIFLLMVVCSMAAWVLARNNTRFYSLMYVIMTMGTLIPFQCIMLPLYLNMFNAGLVSTNLGFIIARSGLQVSISILVITSFVKTVPKELEQAAEIDGCGRFQTFWKIVFPLLKPMTVTLFILTFMNIWNDFGTTIYFLNTSENYTLPLTIYNFFSTHSSDWNLVFTDVVIVSLPVVLLYFCAQKQIMSGMTSGAVKG